MIELKILTFLLVVINMVLGVGIIIIFSLVYKFGTRTPCIKKDKNFLPYVSIVIPTRNEEVIIEERLKNIINMDYPAQMLEVIFVDDSDDRTSHIINEYKKKYPYIKLVKQKKSGFNNALNQGYSAAIGDIIIKSDCDAFPLSDALRKIVANFADSRIGAVSGVYYFNSLGKLGLEKLFRDVQLKFKLTEAYFHSALISHGGFGGYRRDLIPNLPEETTGDDSELVINVVKNGFRAIIDTTVKVINPSPEDFSERRKQLDRRAGGIIKVLMKNIRMLFNPHFGKFGLITMPMEFFILVIAPILVLIDMILVLIFTIYQPLIAIIILIAVALLLISTRYFILSRVLLDTYISCLHGIILSFTHKKKWEKEKGRQELLRTINISNVE